MEGPRLSEPQLSTGYLCPRTNSHFWLLLFLVIA
jgi:hypothetical protein